MTPFEEFLRLQGNSMMPPPRPTAPAPPSFATSPYLTPQMRGEMGLPFGSLLGTEMSPDLGLPATSAAPAPAREMAAPAPTAGGFANGFTPASQTLPRPIAKGRGPFDDFLASYNLGRTSPEASPFGAAPAQEPSAPRYLQAQPGQQVRGLGGAGGAMGGEMMDPQQMQREAMLAQRYPRAMGRIQQLRGMAKRRGY